jgi:site-specific recombinase XerD
LDLVFPKKDGPPHDRKTVLRSGLHPAIRRAEVKKLDMHALRHTFASLLLSQGAPITDVSSYLGHANPQIPLSIRMDIFWPLPKKWNLKNAR